MVPRSARSSLSVDAVNGEGTGGCAGRSIIAAEVYISIRMQTM